MLLLLILFHLLMDYGEEWLSLSLLGLKGVLMFVAVAYLGRFLTSVVKLYMIVAYSLAFGLCLHLQSWPGSIFLLLRWSKSFGSSIGFNLSFGYPSNLIVLGVADTTVLLSSCWLMHSILVAIPRLLAIRF